jgi:hypothetical protein
MKIKEKISEEKTDIQQESKFIPSYDLKPQNREIFKPTYDIKTQKSDNFKPTYDLNSLKDIKHMELNHKKKVDSVTDLRIKILNENTSLEEKKFKYKVLNDVYDENSIYAKSSANQSEMAKLLVKDFNEENFRSLKRNPDLKYKYFEKIDTKEKAYWLGFIYADGHISKNLDRFRVKVGEKDVNHLKKLCKSLKIKNFNIRDEISKETNKNYSVLSIYNKKFIRDLLYHEVVPSKTRILEFPDIKDDKFKLSFLLGYFDGDGTQGTSRIKSSSKNFLRQIKEEYSINYDIKLIEKKSKFKEKDGNVRISDSKCYALFLGSELFNELLDNYDNSLERKRIRFVSNQERTEKIKENSWKGHHDRKLKATKNEIEELVYQMPKTYIAPIYGVSAKTISNWCEKWNIKGPARGDWAKMYSKGLKPKSKEDWSGIIDFS